MHPSQVSGALLTLRAQTAAAFDEAFAGGKEDFKVGDRLGTSSRAQPSRTLSKLSTSASSSKCLSACSTPKPRSAAAAAIR
jgi:hypothetical protein